MEIKYITDEKGKKNAVLLPMRDWEKIQKDLEAYQQLKNKKRFLLDLNEAIEEMKLVLQGQKEARDAEEFVNEL
jgi:hypothetical protein